MLIYLKPMSKELARRYYSQFVLDLDLFMDETKYKPYVYSEAASDATVDRYAQLGRIFFAVMLDHEPIGEIVLKNIDQAKSCCTLGICMRSDEFKNRGYGTSAEILALEYAFDELGVKTVYADCILKNKRSQHVLKKVGFQETHRDDTFIYYKCDSANWQKPQ